MDFYIKQGDTRPVLAKQLLDEDGAPVSLVGAAVEFHMDDSAGNTVIDGGPCEVTDAAAGWVAYEWQPGDTAEPGDHTGEFQVTYADDGVQTFPNPGNLAISIERELA